MTPIALLLSFVLGACVGSFLHVVVLRWGAGQSIVHPPSRCDGCGRPLRGRDNVPVLSWLALRGRAACCGARVGASALWAEVGLGSAWALAAWGTASRPGLSWILVWPALAGATALGLVALLLAARRTALSRRAALGLSLAVALTVGLAQGLLTALARRAGALGPGQLQLADLWRPGPLGPLGRVPVLFALVGLGLGAALVALVGTAPSTSSDRPEDQATQGRGIPSWQLRPWPAGVLLLTDTALGLLAGAWLARRS